MHRFQIRSGPLIYQVTSWLEIKRIHSNYNGFYTCVAKNRLGETSSTAFLEVIGGKFNINSIILNRKNVTAVNLQTRRFDNIDSAVIMSSESKAVQN